jgi:hypothetical protein
MDVSRLHRFLRLVKIGSLCRYKTGGTEQPALPTFCLITPQAPGAMFDNHEIYSRRCTPIDA